MFQEICSFFGDEELSNRRKLRMISALSRTARHEMLLSHGLSFGPINIQYEANSLQIHAAAECAVPPLGWWNVEGAVAVSSNSAPNTACELIALLAKDWTRAKLTKVALKHEDEVEKDAQEVIVKTLTAAADDLTDLRLENFFLTTEDALPFFPNLRNIFLTGYSGPLEKWNAVLNGSAGRVEICDTVAFTNKSFAGLTDASWYRLILDNTNVDICNLELLKCGQTLNTLSLIDCRKIDSFNAELFPELRLLLLSRTPISDDWFTGIETCTHLHLINLGGCHDITDINALGQLKELREIFAHETGVTNDGIAGLSGCENLEKLNLGGCRNVSNVNHLGSLIGLKELHLWSTKTFNDGIQGLCHCTSLTELVLDDCSRITDVAALSHLPSLRWLSLIGTEVNEHGVKELIHCGSLETLALAGTRVDNPPKLWRHEAIIEYLSGF